MRNRKQNNSAKKKDEQIVLKKEELQNMKVNFSIEIPKKDFDELIKAMMNIDELVNEDKTPKI